MTIFQPLTNVSFRDVVAKDRYIECIVVQFGEEFAQVIYRLQIFFCNDNGPIDIVKETDIRGTYQSASLAGWGKVGLIAQRSPDLDSHQSRHSA